jgi:hypothetical protein
MSREPTDDDKVMIAMLKDCTEASVALSNWFASQQISPAKAIIVVSILLTSLAETDGGLTDRKIDKILHHIRKLTRAAFRDGERRRRKHTG